MHQFKQLKIVGFLFCLSVFLLSCSENSSRVEKPDWETITHKDANFSIEYPTKWSYSFNSDLSDSEYRGHRTLKVTIFNRKYPRSGEPGVWIHIFQKPFLKPTLEDVQNWADEELDRNSSIAGMQYPYGYQELIYRKENLGSYIVRRRRYVKFNAKGFVFEEIMIPLEDKMTIIKIRGDPDHFHEVYSDFERIVSSFQTVEP